MIEQQEYKPNELPESVTLPLTLYYGVDGYAAGKIGAYCFDWDGDTEKVVLCKTHITVEIPHQDNLKGKLLETLEAEKKKIQAETHVKLTAIQEKIDNLLAIEYKPGEAGESGAV